MNPSLYKDIPEAFLQNMMISEKKMATVPDDTGDSQELETPENKKTSKEMQQQNVKKELNGMNDDTFLLFLFYLLFFEKTNNNIFPE